MKTNEIMIGDYLQVEPSGMAIRISTIHKKEVGYKTCQNRISFVKEELLDPIPLTPEILEKNGFKKSEYDENMYYWSFSITSACISYDKETGIVRIFKTLGNLVFAYLISYVHELQHALRLCEIKKEIKL